MKRKTRKRKSRPPIAWGPTLGVLFAANTAAGLCLSPITSLTKVRVVNSLPSQEEQLSKSLKELKGIPFVLIHWGWVENKATLTGAYEKISIQGNLFGRATLTLTPRAPIAVVAEPEAWKGLSLDQEGRVFATEIVVAGSPSVSFPTTALSPTASLAQTIESRMAAKVALLLSANWPREEWKLLVAKDSTMTVEAKGRTKRLGVLNEAREALPLLVETFGEPGASTSRPEQSEKEKSP